jgi:hypothetical protein
VLGGIFEFLVQNTKNTVLRDMMPCSLKGTNDSKEPAASIFQVQALEQHNTETHARSEVWIHNPAV